MSNFKAKLHQFDFFRPTSKGRMRGKEEDRAVLKFL